jgi:hypothetical protein
VKRDLDLLMTAVSVNLRPSFFVGLGSVELGVWTLGPIVFYCSQH